MPARTRLFSLARLAGVAPSYEDAWGRRRRLPRERVAALLGAVGVPVPDEPAVRAAIERLGARPWRRAAPVIVAREGEALHVPVVLPASASGAVLAWRLRGERADEHTGSAAAGGLPRLAARRLEGVRLEQRLLELPVHLEAGSHVLSLDLPPGAPAAADRTPIIVAPRRCYLPPALASGVRVWGFAVQLYALRSGRNWGIGDFTDLERLLEGAHELGAALVGVNPLHALFLSRPDRASPYAPSSRSFLNVLYVDVERVDEFAECAAARERVASPPFQERLAALRAASLVDYPGVAACKLEILDEVYCWFRQRHLSGGPTARGEAFRRFQHDGGPDLRAFATFEALAEHFADAGHGAGGWDGWPEHFRAPDAEAVREFASAREERLEYFEYLQWLAHLQLGRVAARAEGLGLPVGLYRDLAIGVAPDGADVWTDRESYPGDATIGAPPDIWNPLGQDWSLQPMHPEVLRERAYCAVIRMLRANMREAGALRMDHALALMHLYWIPRGRGPAQGGYVQYPLDDLLGVLALESHRGRCLVIGEDLGTVPEHFRARLGDEGIFSYRLLYFEKDSQGRFLPPHAYPRLALASVTTHDLATLPGYWVARDLSERARLELFPSREHQQRAFEERERDRRALLEALAAEGLWPGDPGDPPADLDGPLLEAIYTFLARSPSLILVVQLEDVLGQIEQANLPGTIDEHPNWRRKLPSDLNELLGDPRLVSLAHRLTEVRSASGAART